jgi:hypothetical protein
MTEQVTETPLNLSIKFNVKADVAHAFVQDLPHKKLQKLRALLSAYGATVESVGKSVMQERDETTNLILKNLLQRAKKVVSDNPELRLQLEGEITVQLADDRNVRPFLACLMNGGYDDVINLGSIKIDLQRLNQNSEIPSIHEIGIVNPPYPPEKAGYHFE